MRFVALTLLVAVVGCEHVVLVRSGNAPGNTLFVATVDGTRLSERLEDFPVLVRVPTGVDATVELPETLSVFGEDDQSLAFERIDADGESRFWVRVPALETAEIELRFVGAAGDGTSGEPVFDDDFVAVYHLNSDDLADSTGASGNGSNRGTEPGVGLLGEARVFSGEPLDSILFNQRSLPVGASPRTICALVNVTKNNEGFHPIVSYGTRPVVNQGSMGTERIEGGYFLLQHAQDLWCGNSARQHIATSAVQIGAQSEWAYLCCSYDGATGHAFVNGFERGDGTPLALDTQPGGAQIGGVASERAFFDGIVDEVRISQVARSAAWIEAEYLNVEGTWVQVSVASGP